jgi:hypothetical protein
MINRVWHGIPVALALLAVAAPVAAAAPVSVNVRVEGTNGTIFDGPVTTDGHAVTTPSSGGAQTCDGTNAGANPSPVPVATAALDDAARLSSAFTWDGTFSSEFSDFFVTRIGTETADPNSEFWSLYVDQVSASVGGCQQRVVGGQEVLWARISFLATDPIVALKLRGPGAARTGEPVNMQVVDGETGAPQAGATVNGSPTGSDGIATLTFADKGIYRLKAERPGEVRSNTVVLCVDPPGADPCTSSDSSAPSLDLALPGERLASERGRSRTMLVSWQADDATGAGVSYYSAEVREVTGGPAAAQLEAGEWRTLRARTNVPRVHFRGDSGKAYQFRIGAVDRAANRRTVETDPIVLPVDDRDRGRWRFSRGWKRARSESAWGDTVITAKRVGATATLRFEGRSVALIGRKLVKGGRLRVSLDGKSRALRLRGRSAPRTVLWQSQKRSAGMHVLRIRSLGGGPVQLDAVAPQP